MSSRRFTTIGDANIVRTMIERRRDMSDSLNSIETAVCTLGVRQMPIRDIAFALGKRRDGENARSAAKTTGGDAAYNLAFQNMRPILPYTRQPPSKAAATLLGPIDGWRTALADPLSKTAQASSSFPPQSRPPAAFPEISPAHLHRFSS
jgi:hypothetical protein